eukprot:2733705-Pleurochrysis_carterae.AAC.1
MAAPKAVTLRRIDSIAQVDNWRGCCAGWRPLGAHTSGRALLGSRGRSTAGDAFSSGERCPREVGAIGDGRRGNAGLRVMGRGVCPCTLSGDVPGAHQRVHLRPWQSDGNAVASVARRLWCGCTSRSRWAHASVRIEDESRSASIAGSSESTSSQGWNGWSGSEDLPIRRTHAAPWPRSARFMTPLLSEAEGKACATSGGD